MDILNIVIAFLISLSPLGEARSGLPYALINGINPYVAFAFCLVANLLVFPMITFFIDTIDKRLWRNKLYREITLKLLKRAKSKVGSAITKYGFWGLMIFVMIPLPITGAYMGSIAAHIFRIKRTKAFYAISIGILVSCIIVATGTQLSILGVKSF